MLFYRFQIYGPGDLCSKFTPKIAPTLKKFKSFNDFIDSSSACFQGQMEFVYPNTKSPNLDYLCYPEGFRLYRLKAGEAATQSPQSFPFVVTSEEGSRCYITCLKFYEKLPEASNKGLRDAFNRIVSGTDETLKSDNEQQSQSQSQSQVLEQPVEDLYFQKCICIFCRMPYFTFAREWVEKFYKHYISNDRDPSKAKVSAEKAICSLIHSIPCPVPGGPEIQYSICGEPFQATLRAPLSDGLPNIDAPLVSFFQNYTLQNILELIKIILLGEKLIFVSESNILLTLACEAMIGLIYPFKLPGPFIYIPVLGRKAIDCIDSPTAYIIGLPMSVFKKIKTIPQDATIFVIERGAIIKPTAPQSVNYVNGSLPAFPTEAVTRLADDVKRVLCPLFFGGSCDAIEFDTWKDSAVSPCYRSNIMIQAAFVRFFAYILQ